MLFFAIFTLGYFIGVVTVLTVFPPRVKEIEEQEVDTFRPILETKLKKEPSHATSFGLPVSIRMPATGGLDLPAQAGIRN